MSNPAAPLFYIDRPSHWQPAAARMEIAGWLYAGEEMPCRDMRARVDGRIYLGLFGLIRPDTESVFGSTLTARHTGFLQEVEVWRGARELALDWHDGREWREFFRTTLDTTQLPATATRPALRLRTGLVFASLQYLYRHFHRASWADLCAETDRVLDEVLPHCTEVAIGANLLGHIENPGPWINAGYDKFRVTGWVFGIGHDLSQLCATTGVTTENRLVYPKERPDVADHRKDHANALRSGFYGLVDLKGDTPSPACLKLFADTPDGRRSLAFARRIYLDRRDEHSGPVPVFRPWFFRRVVAAFLRGVLLGRYRLENWPDARREIDRLRQHLSTSLASVAAPPPAPAVIRRRDQDPYTRWCWHNRLTPALRQVLQADAETALAAGGPLISVVVPAYNTPEKFLRELLDCLKGQLYPRWELCIADDASPKPHVRRMLEEAARQDPRIRPVFRSENGHISRATNSALDVSTGDFVALLDHDDVLPHDALLHVAQAILRQPGAGYLYTDEDKIDDTGRRFDPQFKGGWSPEMAITHNYTHHLTVIRRSIVEQAGRLRPECNGAQDIDLFLRCWELLPDAAVVHVPYIGYHWRAHAESTASRGDQKGYLFDAARRAIAEAVARRGLRAEPVLPEFARQYALCLHQLRWSSDLLRENPVTIVIPTKDRVDLLRPCLESIARTTPSEAVRVVVVDDGSTDPVTLDYLRDLPSRTDFKAEVVRAPAADAFNYSRLVNLGTARATTPLVLHLNNDVEALQPGWLEDMVGWMSNPEVGVVGAKLLYPDGTVNHAGISISREDGLAHVLFEKSPGDDLGYLFLPHAARNVAAVTGACLLTRTELYRTLGGFEEERLQVAYNDVDYCLRAAAAGSRVVYTPQAVLRHLGSASRGRAYAEREHVAWLERHGGYRDPYHSEAMDFPPASLALNPYHQRYAATERPFHALILTHNLNFEGAPIFIFELARDLAARPGMRLTIASPQDGPLRTRYEALGLPVEIWDAGPWMTARRPEDFTAALHRFAGSRQWDNIDVFVCNTLLTFWGVQLAQHVGKPSAWYLHESKPVRRFFEHLLPPALHSLAEAALPLATRVVFTARATRQMHEELNHNDNFRTLPSWVDFDHIERFKAAHDRRALRRKHGLDPDATVIVNIGSICERKGQHIFIRALDRLRDEPPTLPAGHRLQWVMVGARDGLYMETLREDIQLMGLQEVVIFPETGDIYDFYLLADLLVCTSFEESFPRVLLEAMVFENRIVSTNVNGIPEMLTNTDEALLVPAGDPHKLAATLKTCLAAHFAGDRKMLSMAYARAARNYHHARILPIHRSMIREAWLG